MPAGASGPDPYEILGVPRDADSADIRKAYQALALQVHPDKLTREDAAEASATGATVTFQQLQDAWETLRNEGSRAAYDEIHRLGEQAAEAHLAEVDLDDMEYDESQACFIWPCRCSSRFIVRETQLEEQLDTFECDTCALKIRVLYDFLEGDEDECEDEAGEGQYKVKAGDGEAAEPEPERAE